MSAKIPVHCSLTICTEGVNHILQYNGKDTVRAAYRTIRDTPADGEYEISDDYGATVTGPRSGVRSMRVENINEMHRASQNMEIIKMYNIREFGDLIDKEHPGLKLIRAQANAGSSLIHPRN